MLRSAGNDTSDLFNGLRLKAPLRNIYSMFPTVCYHPNFFGSFCLSFQQEEVVALTSAIQFDNSNCIHSIRELTNLYFNCL